MAETAEVNEVYRENFNELCQEKFGKSASEVIIKDMEKSNNQLTRIYKGKFPKQKAVKKDFEDYFSMSYAAIISYIEHGPYGDKWQHSAPILREIIKNAPPDYDTLFEFLNISKEEWNKAISGENEFCYIRAEELEDYFDLAPDLLIGEAQKGVTADTQKTHAFSPYPIEEAQGHKENAQFR